MSRKVGGSVPLVIGIGNADRGDDGAGPLAAARIAAAAPAAARVLVRAADPLGLLDEWTSEDEVILIDAAAARSTPGAIHRWVADEHRLPLPSVTGSTHGLGVATALALARGLGRMPRRLVVYAIEGASFERGGPLDPAVERSVGRVTARILDDLRALARHRRH